MKESGGVLISLDASLDEHNYEILSEIYALGGIYKKLMKLVFHIGFTRRELAEILSISQATVHLRTQKNQKYLREKLIKG